MDSCISIAVTVIVAGGRRQLVGFLAAGGRGPGMGVSVLLV